MFVVAWEIYWGALCQLPCQLYLLNVNDRNERIDESIRMPWIYKLMRPSFFSQFQKTIPEQRRFSCFLISLYFEIINRIIFGLLIHEYLVHKKISFSGKPVHTSSHLIKTKYFIYLYQARSIATPLPPPPIFEEVKIQTHIELKWLGASPPVPPKFGF